MTSTDTPWEPPLAGDEVGHLVGALDRLRWTFRWKAGGLDAEDLQTRIAASAITLGGLLKHLACVEDVTFTWKLRGAAPGSPWQEIDWDADPDWDWRTAAADTPEQLYALYDGAVTRSRERLAAALLDGGSTRRRTRPTTTVVTSACAGWSAT